MGPNPGRAPTRGPDQKTDCLGFLFYFLVFGLMLLLFRLKTVFWGLFHAKPCRTINYLKKQVLDPKRAKLNEYIFKHGFTKIIVYGL